MSSENELAASRAAREAYAFASLAADHRKHVDIRGTASDRPSPDSTETTFGATRPDWANRRGSAGR